MKTKRPSKVFDCVVVGLGPAGICSAIKLMGTKTKTLLLDANDYIGGMAFETDVNLQSINGFPPESNFGERVVGSQKTANQIIKDVYKMFNSYGLPYSKVHLHLNKLSNSEEKINFEKKNDVYSYPVKVKVLEKMTKNILKDLLASQNVKIQLKTTVKEIIKGSVKQWGIFTVDGSGRKDYLETDSLILGTGKLSANWLTDLYNKLGIENNINNKISLGIRIEDKAININRILVGQHNPKIKIIENGIVSETFCWCKNGGVISYGFGDGLLLDGEHLFTKPTINSNFGIMVSIDLPKNVSSLEFGMAFMRYINVLGDGRILTQRLSEFRKNIINKSEDIKSGDIKATLKNTTVVNIRGCFPEIINNGILLLIDKINTLNPGSITDKALVYAPVVERIFPDTQLDKSMETNLKGIYVAGDCSGKSIGVSPSCIMGYIAAESIAKKYYHH